MWNPYLKIAFKIIVLNLLLFSNLQLWAVDLVGADIYYEYLTPLNYKIHLIKYRDCSGPLMLQTTDSVQLSSSSNSMSFKIVIDTNLANYLWNGKYFGNTPSPSIATTCTDPQSKFSGYQYFHFVGLVTLPYVAADWEFQWQGDSRGSNVTNVADSTLCLRAGLNNTSRANNSCIFTSLPFLNFGLAQPFNYLNSPLDPDVDSLFIINQTPSTNSVPHGNQCFLAQYNSPYTVNNPIASGSPIQLNPLTGTYMFTPSTTGKYVVRFRADEYDAMNASRVGFMEREIQLHFLTNMWPVGLGEIDESNNSLMLYPNPVRDELYIKLVQKKSNEIFDLCIYNSLGQKVLSKKIKVSKPLNVGFLPSGFYYAEISHDALKYKRSFFKQ